MSELPSSWARAALGDICAQPTQRVPSVDEDFTYIDIASVDRDRKSISEPQRLPGAEAPSRARKVVEAGDVIVSMTRPNLNAVALVGAEHNECIASTGFDVLKPIEVEPRWIFAAVRSAQFVDAMCDKVQGALYPAVKSADIREHEIPLPPLAEQTRIAQKLDELLAQVDTLKARIDGIPALLKRFRQSVLAAAVSGRLTEEWRAQNFGCVDEGGPITEPASSSLPVGWSSKTAGDICGFITKGTTPSKEKMTAGHGEVPYIKVYNLTFTGALDFSIDPTFVDSSTHSTDLKRSIVKPGDVLMNIVGPPLGKVSIVPATYPEWNINQAIARFRAGDEISAAYLALCLRTDEVLSHAISRAKATAGQFNLTLEICRELPLPVPPAEEQTEIVRRVEQLFAFADQLEAKVASAKSRIDHLTQSILAKAFRGELVPQDPNDEPASVLLERIKAQRAAAPKAKRGRKASA
ncbi:TPA: restriction endonuclease subunit S [Pseudomonas aeruginosa]|nr:restriction endonuclease subunit S [Pseudomonas aeruginosa]HCF7192847.1 restriction endonuclease subunit S [Pseudomonas aeruginosa]